MKLTKIVNLSHPTKTRFVVIGGNILGFLLPGHASMAGVLTSSLLNGAPKGNLTLPADGKGVRFATPNDFKAFKVDPTPYIKDRAFCDFPVSGPLYSMVA